MSVYTAGAVDALALLKEFSMGDATITVDNSTFAPVTGVITADDTAHTAACVMTSYSQRERAAGLVGITDFKMSVAADAITFEPGVKDKVAFGGVSYNIKAVERVPPAGDAIIFFLRVAA